MVDSSTTYLNNLDFLTNVLTILRFKEHFNYLRQICINHVCENVKLLNLSNQVFHELIKF